MHEEKSQKLLQDQASKSATTRELEIEVKKKKDISLIIPCTNNAIFCVHGNLILNT